MPYFFIIHYVSEFGCRLVYSTIFKYVRIFDKQKMVIQIHNEIRHHFQNIQDI